MNKDYEEGELVDFVLRDEYETSGVGIIRGIANTGVPILGKTYIVQVISSCPSFGSTYPYSCIAAFELFLKPHEKD